MQPQQDRVQVAPVVFRTDLVLTISDAVVKELEARESEFFETGAVDLSALIEASQREANPKWEEGGLQDAVEYGTMKFNLSQERSDSCTRLHQVRKDKALQELYPYSDVPSQLQLAQDCKSWIEDTRKFPILLKAQIKTFLQERAGHDRINTGTEGLGEHDLKSEEDLKAIVQRIKSLSSNVTSLVNSVNGIKMMRATESKGLDPQPPKSQPTEAQESSGLLGIAGLTDRLEKIQGNFSKLQEIRGTDIARIVAIQEGIDEALNSTAEDEQIFGASESFEPSALQPAVDSLALEHFPALVTMFKPDFQQYQDSNDLEKYFYQAIERPLALIHELLMSPTEGENNLVPAYELEEGEIFDVESLLAQGLQGLL
ncbi:unnamed protein product [Cyclocybe aegerita]|uniref:Uncharacterized protein n=1 Tax=Cyclocybe aegerita TaxID=1973307 RepID=A0A8S0VQG0_CYCAE|nr:unnamed protein product [Cyclocybe aegerita]